MKFNRRLIGHYIDLALGHLISKVMVGFLLWFYFRVWHRRKINIVGNIPLNIKGCVFYSNHPSLLETMLLPILWWPLCVFRPDLMPYIPAAKENYFPPNCRKIPLLKKIPFIKNLALFRWLVSHGNTIMVKSGREDPRALKKMVEKIKKGSNVLLFPEGTRTRNGELNDFRMGLAQLIRLAEPKSVIPIWIEGTNKILPIGKEWPDWKNGQVTIIFGQDLNITNNDLRLLRKAAGWKALFNKIAAKLAPNAAENRKNKLIISYLTEILRFELLSLKKNLEP